MKTLLALRQAIQPLAEVERSEGLAPELRDKVREGLDMLCAALRFLETPPEPGPWTYREGRIHNAEGWHLSNMHPQKADVADVAYSLGDETDEADGRLIAASPVLLELLVLVWRKHQQSKVLTAKEWARIEAALAPFALWPALAGK